MAKIQIELTDEELDQIHGGISILKEISYQDHKLRTVICSIGAKSDASGKDEPGNNDIFIK